MKYFRKPIVPSILLFALLVSGALYARQAFFTPRVAYGELSLTDPIFDLIGGGFGGACPTSAAYSIPPRPPEKVFGGQITGVLQCGCSGSHLIKVGLPRPGIFHFGPWSLPHEYCQFKRPGAWVLGTVEGRTPCLVPCLSGCCGVPHDGNILLIGSSR